VRKVNKKSAVFKDRTFCIDKAGYNSEEVEDIETIIYENGGNVLESTIEKSIASHMIHNDAGPTIPDQFSFHRDATNGKYNVSHRFINKCIEERKFLSLKSEKGLNLLPMKFPCPHPKVLENELCFVFTCFDTKDKEIMTQLANLIGAKTTLREGETTHIIVNDDYVHKMSKA
jgi:hypothetical protein